MTMRADYDAAAKWAPFPRWEGAELRRDGWTARPILGLYQVLLSGDFPRMQPGSSEPLSEAGLWAVMPEPLLLVRVARDRALFISAKPIPLTPGWHAEGWAASAVDGAYAVFELSGPGMTNVVREAVSADLEAGSPSAAVLFAGVPAFLTRTAQDVARLHVEAALAPFIWRWLELRAEG